MDYTKDVQRHLDNVKPKQLLDARVYSVQALTLDHLYIYTIKVSLSEES